MRLTVCRTFLPTAICALLVLACCRLSGAAPLAIVAEGKSTRSIVIPALAPESVKEAAAEMQRDIAEASGAKLPIVKDSELTGGAFISLASTRQAREAGITTEKMAYDAFRIVTKANNLFIIGIDTTTAVSDWFDQTPRNIKLHPEVPGPAFTKTGGFSNGTANGVYSFLEDEWGVRWLFPGDLGRVVPSRSTLTVEPTDRTFEPKFNFRVMSILRNSGEWRTRQRLSYSVNAQYVHNFQETVPLELYKTHPEWFPMIGGTRPQPHRHSKLETTNPELVNYFAQKAIAALKAKPELYSYSLSPSDGLGWSESPESKALYDPPVPGSFAPSVTPLVLKFYRDVSAIVAKEYPQGMLGGFLYTVYSYPPQKGSMELPKNFIPTIVGKSMGYNFYRPEVRELEAKLLNEWAKVAPENWYYYGMPTWMRESSGQITPAAPKEMNFLFRSMLDAHIKGADLSGTFMWSQGALVNYVTARMLWNPSGDAVEVQRDWLMNAYGPKAGPIMEQLYNKMDESWWADYFRGPQSSHYNISDILFRTTFGKYYPQMEKLFLEAWNQPMTEKQKQRLDLIRQNMIVLQWRLRNGGSLPEEYSSPLQRSSKEIFTLLTDPATKDNFSYTLLSTGGDVVSPVKVELSDAKAAVVPAATDSPPNFPNSKFILLYPTRDGEVTLKPYEVMPGYNFLSYIVQDSNKSTLARGFLSSGDDITFQAKANQPLYFWTKRAGVSNTQPVKWKISIPGAVAAKGVFRDGTLSLLNTDGQPPAPLYVYTGADSGVVGEASAAGTVIQTEPDEVVRSRAARLWERSAVRALEDAKQRYGATVVQNLNLGWRFTTDPEKEGDAKGYFKPEFNDRSWKTIQTTFGSWHDHGFPGYYGTAWYRKTINLSTDETDPLAMGNKELLLFFGAIDGDAEIYLNGIKIESRIMAEHNDGSEQPVAYSISKAVQPGKNVIAVKVTKDRFAAGLVRGVSILAGVLPN